MDTIPDTTAITLINSMFALMGVIFTGMMAYYTAKLNIKADKAAIEVKEVKQVLSATTDNTHQQLSEMAKVTDATHVLVNNNMGVQLKITMILADRVAELTKNKKDIQAAKEAHHIYDEHMKKQTIVDKMTAINKAKSISKKSYT